VAQKMRRSGILLHPTSLPGPDGIGDLGPEAYRWVDFLADSGTQMWQVLPLGPTGYGDSPYQCFSAFAGNPYLVSPLLLLEEGLLSKSDMADRQEFPNEQVDFGPVINWKLTILDRAYEHFKVTKDQDILNRFRVFLESEQNWLEDYALFMAIKADQGGESWLSWPMPLRSRNPELLAAKREQLAADILKEKFKQFLFFEQWEALHQYARGRGILIIGDMPFVISMDSADVWANPELFLMDEEIKPTFVAGVPPDYFSVTGQLWGNPLYRWEVHQKQDFKWWKDRLSAVLKLVDLVRLDHFRGFAAAWHVPFGNPTAIEGKWINSKGQELFAAFKAAYPSLPIIAEDLGVITEDVKALRDGFGLPGMKILQFGFTGDPEDDFLPHHYPENCFAYTGSHDNNTARGWYNNATKKEKDFCRGYLNTDGSDIAWSMMRAIWQSVAADVVAPMQDLLSLPENARMNMPGVESGNWSWRMSAGSLSPELAKRFYELNLLYSRLPEEQKAEYTEKLTREMAGEVKPH